MTKRADFSVLWERIRPQLELQNDGRPNYAGWVTGRCIFPRNHDRGDRNGEHLRIHPLKGSVACMSQGCISGNLNDLAEALGISVELDEVKVTPTHALPTPTVEELATARRLPADVLRLRWGVTALRGGWSYPLDDPDGQSYQRIKSLPGEKPKYRWKPAGAKAADLVYNLTRIPADSQSLLIVAGEPDCWVADNAGIPTISFLAGETSLPSARALAKLRQRLPRLIAPWICLDTDSAGKAGARRLAELLAQHGWEPIIISLPEDLGEKGDLTDLWLRLEGDAGALKSVLFVESPTEQLKPVRPTVDQLDVDAFRVRMPTLGGFVQLDFESIYRHGRDFETEVTITIEVAGVNCDPYTTDIDLSSTSGREGLRREMEKNCDAITWPPILNGAYARVREAFLNFDASVNPALIERRQPGTRYRIDGLLPEGYPTVSFGDGASGKTFLAIAQALCVAYGVPFLGRTVRQSKVLYLDYETDALEFEDRGRRLLAGWGREWEPGAISYWRAEGRPFADLSPLLQKKIAEENVGLLVIDSAAAACGGDPEKAEVAQRFFTTLARLKVTTHIVAHVTKASDQKKPFGSVFWHNYPRMTWNVQRQQEEEEDLASIVLWNRKSNSSRLFRPIGVEYAFEGEDGPVRLKTLDVSSVPEFEAQRSARERILDQLNHGQQSAPQLANATGIPVDQVRARLNEMKGKRVLRLGEEREAPWGRLVS